MCDLLSRLFQYSWKHQLQAIASTTDESFAWFLSASLRFAYRPYRPQLRVEAGILHRLDSLHGSQPGVAWRIELRLRFVVRAEVRNIFRQRRSLGHLREDLEVVHGTTAREFDLVAGHDPVHLELRPFHELGDQGLQILRLRTVIQVDEIAFLGRRDLNVFTPTNTDFAVTTDLNLEEIRNLLRVHVILAREHTLEGSLQDVANRLHVEPAGVGNRANPTESLGGSNGGGRGGSGSGRVL